MNRYFLSLLLTFGCVSFSLAKDFGIVAPIFPIVEQDFLLTIQARLQDMQASGELDKKKAQMQETVKNQVLRPTAKVHLSTSSNMSSYLVDPSLTLGVDITDGKGGIIYPKGTVVNPFDSDTFPEGMAYQVAYSKTLVFLDADDDAQVAWLLRYQAQSKEKTKVIITNGEPVRLEEKIHQRVYFEQTGDLVSKFHLKHVPSTVKQEGKHWRVTQHDPSAINTQKENRHD
ncbi:type-F conjugative transfer system protein TraW [Vibrio cyclitrophicus]|uniref:Type-F conjugative transfer system protein TraW n=2 Tax=Vibrio cyclitrophicus TaxID=47951 RepID=A0A7Z1MK56_9VIBR|nr:type-F conjugative transfer system protein TraW [Vibrio cyclitrophicus]PMP21136.1 type-F conjugative transfer system protein TraW [Vibrio cyclitrophicus]PMP30517.1 type-F conjugative transfer system protein TraW [Vibrio cyclitrophicus]